MREIAKAFCEELGIVDLTTAYFLQSSEGCPANAFFPQNHVQAVKRGQANLLFRYESVVHYRSPTLQLRFASGDLKARLSSGEATDEEILDFVSSHELQRGTDYLAIIRAPDSMVCLRRRDGLMLKYFQMGGTTKSSGPFDKLQLNQDERVVTRTPISNIIQITLDLLYDATDSRVEQAVQSALE